MATTKAHDLARLLADGVVGTSEIGDDQVTTAKIPDNAVTTAKIANSAVTADKINIASSDVPYDNTVSGLSANTVKEAIDALNAISGGGNAGAQATFSREKFTATAGQTSFTVTGGYDVGYLLVFMNGVLLDISDFTASDGVGFTLAVAAKAGDEIVAIKLDSFAIAELLRVTQISASASDDVLTIDANDQFIVDGNMTVGANTSVGGLKGISLKYADGALTTFGAQASSGGPVIGYGVHPKNGAADSYVSSTGISLNRSALAMDAEFKFYMGSPQTVAVDSDVSMDVVMSIDPSGRVNTPYQPNFFAMRNALSHVTSSGDIVFDYVPRNVGGHYNNTNGRFTAPVTGTYMFCFNTLLYNMGYPSAASLYVNGSSYYGMASLGNYGSFTGNYAGQGGTVVVGLNAGDYATIYFAHAGTNLHNNYTFWSGCLIG